MDIYASGTHKTRTWIWLGPLIAIALISLAIVGATEWNAWRYNSSESVAWLLDWQKAVETGQTPPDAPENLKITTSTISGGQRAQATDANGECWMITAHTAPEIESEPATPCD